MAEDAKILKKDQIHDTVGVGGGGNRPMIKLKVMTENLSLRP